jgi:hypothetical protein
VLPSRSGFGAVTVGGRQLSEARRYTPESRPSRNVVVFTEGSGNDPRHHDLVIKNFGMTAATDVRVVFSAPLESAVLRGPPNHSPIRTPDVIPVLVPGQEWRTFWDFTAARAGASDLPDEYTATVTFSDSGGEPVNGEYRFVIDWRVLIDRTSVTVYNLHNAAEALREISDALRKRKLDVVVRDGDALDERNRTYYADKERRQRAESGTATRLERLADRVERVRQRIRG